MPDNNQNQNVQETAAQQTNAQAGDEILWKDRKHFMWFPFSFTKYCVRKGRIYIDKGLLNTVQDQTLLYRIIDIQLRRSLAQRIFRTGTVALVTKADMDHEILLENIKNPQKVNDLLADAVEAARHQRNVVGKEFYSVGMPGHPPVHDPDMMPDDGFDDGDSDDLHDAH